MLDWIIDGIAGALPPRVFWALFGFTILVIGLLVWWAVNT